MVGNGVFRLLEAQLGVPRHALRALMNNHGVVIPNRSALGQMHSGATQQAEKIIAQTFVRCALWTRHGIAMIKKPAL